MAGDARELGHPAPDKVTSRILIEPLLDWIVDTDGIDPGDATLHLELGKMNAGLVVEKLPREVVAEGAPIEP